MVEVFIVKEKVEPFEGSIVYFKPFWVYKIYQRLHFNDLQHTLYLTQYKTKKSAEAFVQRKIDTAYCDVVNGGFHAL